MVSLCHTSGRQHECHHGAPICIDLIGLQMLLQDTCSLQRLLSVKAHCVVSDSSAVKEAQDLGNPPGPEQTGTALTAQDIDPS